LHDRPVAQYVSGQIDFVFGAVDKRNCQESGGVSYN